MKSHLIRGWIVALMLVTYAELIQTAQAEGSARVAVAPFVVLGGSAKPDASLEEIYLDELKRRGFHPWEPVKVASFLKQETDGSCHLSDECHGLLTTAVGASVTLAGWVAPDGHQIVVGARLVRADGTVALQSVRSQLHNPWPGRIPPELVRAQIRTVLAELRPELFDVRHSDSGLEWPPPLLSSAAFAVSGVSLIGLGVTWGMAMHDGGLLNKRLDVFGRWGEDDAEAVRLRNRLNTESTLSTLFIVTTVVGAAGGAALWLTARREQPKLTVFPLPGAGFLVRGEF